MKNIVTVHLRLFSFRNMLAVLTWLALMLIALVLLIGPISLVYAADLPTSATKHAYRYLYVREATNRNDHPEIDNMLAYLGLPKGLSWCAAFSIYCYKDAADDMRIKQPWPRYGRVARLWESCKANPLKYQAITADQIRLGTATLKAGDLPIWANGTIRSGDFNGHTGLVIKQLSPRTFSSIEGNTQPGSEGNQREGGGVYRRTREINPGNFRILGFCRLRQ